MVTPKQISKAMSVLAKRGQEKRTPEERTARAKMMASKRWAKNKEKDVGDNS